MTKSNGSGKKTIQEHIDRIAAAWGIGALISSNTLVEVLTKMEGERPNYYPSTDAEMACHILRHVMRGTDFVRDACRELYEEYPEAISEWYEDDPDTLRGWFGVGADGAQA